MKARLSDTIHHCEALRRHHQQRHNFAVKSDDQLAASFDADAVYALDRVLLHLARIYASL